MTLNVVGVCVHGLLGNVFSLGMDRLASELNHDTPVGVHFTVQGGNDPDFVAGSLTADLLRKARAGSVIVPIGHSLGADWVWNFAEAAYAAGVPLPLAISVDPVDWSSDVAGRPAGTWEVPSNVRVAMNFRQPYFPGGGVIVAKDPKRTSISQMTLNVPHANFGQGEAIDTDGSVHAAIRAAIGKLCHDLERLAA